MVLGKAGEGTSGIAEKDLVRVKRVYQEEGIKANTIARVGCESAQEKYREGSNAEVLRRVEEH
jgi:hypothetical protein